jgi:amidohydrolase
MTTQDRNNLLSDIVEDVKACRHELHQHPGTSYEEFYASDLIARKLTEWGITFERGWAGTGIVATIEGQKTDSGKRIGIRADIDALDITETSGQSWASTVPGKMHACGHDGHTSIVLGVARYLQETRNFNGTAHLFFQPAEEGDGGAIKMIAEGLFDKYPVDSVYGIHNWPPLPLGKFSTRKGPLMAGTAYIEIRVTGKGGHAAKPNSAIDPVVIGAEIVLATQTIVSRSLYPFDKAVISITNFNAGTGANNVIPESAVMFGTARAFTKDIHAKIEQRLREIASGIAAAHGAKVEVIYRPGYNPVVNHDAETEFCAGVARDIFGPDNVTLDGEMSMGGEDFGAMLEKKPGCFAFLGQSMPGETSCPHNHSVHHPGYDFNDKLLPLGIQYFTQITERKMKL